jgi:Mce-associated membrane protein
MMDLGASTPIDAPGQVADESSEPEGTTEQASRATRGVPLWAALLLAVLLVVAAIAALMLSHRDNSLQAKANNTQAVAKTASGLGQALLSYNAADLAASRSRVLALATASFTRTYNQDFTKSLDGSITALKATSSATVRDVYVTNVVGTTAKAIVVVDFETKSKAGDRKVLGTNLQMDLVDLNGRWKVNSVTVISATSESQTPTAPSGT